MPQGDKSNYTSKQKRQAEHIEEGIEKRGGSEKDAARIAWATVNKETGGAGRAVHDPSPSRRGGKIGGHSTTHPTQVAAGRKASATRTHQSSNSRSR